MIAVRRAQLADRVERLAARIERRAAVILSDPRPMVRPATSNGYADADDGHDHPPSTTARRLVSRTERTTASTTRTLPGSPRHIAATDCENP